MKNLFYLIIPLFFLSCTETKPPKFEKLSMDKTANFDWLVGSWKRTNEELPKQTYESWSKNSQSEYIGLGFTMVDRKVVWKEDVVLRKVKDQWTFEVTGQGETKATVFVLTEIEDEAFVCENEQNEFPKKIYYFKQDNNIGATISGGGPELSFMFAKVDKR